MKVDFYQDKNGRVYEIDEFRGGELWNFKVTTDGFRPVGYAVCLPCARGELHLADLLIQDELKRPQFAWPWSVLFHRRPKSLRRSGVGSALLERVLEVARREKYRVVTGKICQRDLCARPWLPEWCSRFGFGYRKDGDGYGLERIL